MPPLPAGRRGLSCLGRESDDAMTVRATDDAIADLRSRIGKEIRISAAPYLTEASADAIRHWADGIGDRNPLFHDVSHASTTR